MGDDAKPFKDAEEELEVAHENVVDQAPAVEDAEPDTPPVPAAPAVPQPESHAARLAKMVVEKNAQVAEESFQNELLLKLDGTFRQLLAAGLKAPDLEAALCKVFEEKLNVSTPKKDKNASSSGKKGPSAGSPNRKCKMHMALTDGQKVKYDWNSKDGKNSRSVHGQYDKAKDSIIDSDGEVFASPTAFCLKAYRDIAMNSASPSKTVSGWEMCKAETSDGTWIKLKRLLPPGEEN